MRFVIDLDSLYLIESATDRRPVQTVSVKRGDDAPFEVSFVRSGVAEALAAETVLTFGAKADAKFDGAAVVLSSAFTLAGSGTTSKYTGNPSLNTVGLNALFFIDGNTANDVAYVDLMGEFTWRVGDGAPTSTKTFRFRVYNDVIRGDEGTPLELPTPDAWLAERRPLPLAITCPPNTPQTLVITGTLVNTDTTSVTTPVTLLYAGMVGSKPMWSADGTTGATANYLKWLPAESPFPKWDLRLSTGYIASSTTDKGLPSGLVFTASVGSGVPTVTAGDVVQATQRGQTAEYTSLTGAIYLFQCTDLTPMSWKMISDGGTWSVPMGDWRIPVHTGTDEAPSFAYIPLP